MPSWRRIRLALILIVDGVLIASTQNHKPTPKYVKLVENLDEFFSFPWGRESFSWTLSSMKPARKIMGKCENPVGTYREQMMQSSFRLVGFPLALQLLAFEAIPSLLEKLGAGVDGASLMDIADDKLPKSAQLTLSHVLDAEADEKLIVRAQLEYPLGIPEGWYEWDDEIVDRKVDYMVGKINSGHVFKRCEWPGGDASLPLITHVAKAAGRAPTAKQEKRESPPKKCKRESMSGGRDVDQKCPGGKGHRRASEGADKRIDIVTKKLDEISADVKNLIERFDKAERGGRLKRRRVLRKASSLGAGGQRPGIRRKRTQKVSPCSEGETCDEIQGLGFITLKDDVYEPETLPAKMGDAEVQDKVDGDAMDGIQTVERGESDKIRGVDDKTGCNENVSGREDNVDGFLAENMDTIRSPCAWTEVQPNPVNDGVHETGDVGSSIQEEAAEAQNKRVDKEEFVKVYGADRGVDVESMSQEEKILFISRVEEAWVRQLSACEEEGLANVEIPVRDGGDALVAKDDKAELMDVDTFGVEGAKVLDPRVDMDNDFVDEAKQQRTVDVSDSSPVLERVKHTPMKREVELHKLLKMREVCSLLVPVAEDPDFAAFQTALLEAVDAQHNSEGKFDVSNQFFLDLAEPRKWVDTLHMEVLMDVLGRRHAGVLEAERACFSTPWLISYLQGKEQSFNAAKNKARIVVDKRLAAIVRRPGKVWVEDVDTVYVPMNWYGSHWVGLCINLEVWSIEVLDPFYSLEDDNKVVQYMDPIAAMLPYVVRELCPPRATQTHGVSPFVWRRLTGLYENKRTGDCGPVAVKFMEFHANGEGEVAMGGLSDELVDIFRKQYAVDIYKELVVPLYPEEANV